MLVNFHPLTFGMILHYSRVTCTLTESSRARAHIDPAACFLDVGSSYPGCEAATKGGAVRPLKGNVSWV
ncbi:MAG: hypothetical protein EAX96_08835 [Candidatus Lokiarchaeota archaeon]|nr:hypothetical protein [Candidatus Lokiarchaeota archaeon]